MPLEERRTEVGALALGMFVCRLDRPWSETPFPLQGLLLESQDQIDCLRDLCRYVWIDIEKGIERSPRGLLLRLGFRRERPGGGLLPEPAPYALPVPIDDELPHAAPAWDAARSFAARCIEDIKAGRRVPVDGITEMLEPVVSSVVRNPDAFFWLDALRRRDSYPYSHAINGCALAATFGRQLGFPREMLIDLAASGMLMDIGMSALDTAIFEHAGPLDADAQAAVRGHVELGIERLRAAGLANLSLVEMIAAHHERHDGTGYPTGAAGLAIPLTARMLGIVDAFDAMCSARPHQVAMSRHHALQALYKQRDRLFQAELLEQFSQALGVYPTGSLVELSSGEVAVVMAQNAARRLFPRVTVLTHADKSTNPAFPQVDLWSDGDGNGRRSIVRALPAGAYGLDLADFFL